MNVIFGVLVGLALGLTGGGGSIFALPLLIYGLGLAPRDAVAISLIAVAATAMVGAIEGALRRVVEWRAAAIFAAAGICFAPLGVWLGGQVPGGVTVLGFAALMLIVAVSMIVKARRQPEHARVIRARVAEQASADATTVCRYSGDGRLRLTAPCSFALLGAGVLVGVLSGFFGVGGGFLIVPALMLVTAMGIHRAVATSLLVIALVGSSGVISAVVAGRHIEPATTALFMIGGIIGMGGGRVLARYLAGHALQFVFAGGMIALAVFMLFERLLPGV
ncbi:sulfite exporter TauE/SafE family protein [Salinisphaera sp.]|uniref:sulfite exporter TauE/SafE family protein n=1 Tax=Salinisphaera sp. TaxID=1914330 RepID=UPI002D77E7D6|nr:sulfite exporter TauE/SafE family protein [Salinisphaera sp.]HET7315744.1 sulfite exporter TauE/SafE family protein [Salinisphaera sp.]